ncbi:hypothetical protein [Streptomyces sp. NPDC097610]|uniref:hypothetical protein n=1 Tax=Streptomyces sp. NPDC097610 TaxID=3157227 RepID=UPI00332B7356
MSTTTPSILHALLRGRPQPLLRLLRARRALDDGFFHELRDRVRAQVTEAINTNGHFAMTKYTGSFLCR